MKIICSSCKKVIGVQYPSSDDSEILAKCPECFQKEEKEALQPQPLPRPGERVDIVLKHGLKGYLAVADNTTKLSANELMVFKKTFTCLQTERDGFLEYLKTIEKDQVDITFLYSTSVKVVPLARNKKSKGLKREEASNSEFTSYNCTVTAPTHYAISMFDSKAEQIGGLLDIVAAGIAEEWIIDYQGAKKEGIKGRQ